MDGWKAPFCTISRFMGFVSSTLNVCFRKPLMFRSLVKQMDRIGVASLTIVNVCAVFIGIVLTLQIAFELMRYGAEISLSKIVSVAFLRELGPVFTAIMISGRMGSGIAAELGSMQVTEQVDALRTMGADPYRYLVIPRVLAAFIMVPALTLIADAMGIASGLLTAHFVVGIPFGQYMAASTDSIILLDVLSGLIKGAVFGLLIGLISTFIGLETERATEAVGRSTTKAMVACAYAILIVDFLLTKTFFLFL